MTDTSEVLILRHTLSFILHLASKDIAHTETASVRWSQTVVQTEGLIVLSGFLRASEVYILRIKFHIS